MFDLSELYYPITANPAEASEVLPCQALRPYIRCFWGTAALPQTDAFESKAFRDQPASLTQEPEVVIPDTCMDIIWEWDMATGEAGGFFCGINDAPFETGQADQPSGKLYFAIRFHFWAVHLFADEHLRDVLNVHVPVEHYFGAFRRELGRRLVASRTFTERIAAAENYLLRRLDRKEGGSHDSMMNAVYSILRHRGVVNVRELENSAAVSSRQLERLFREYIGLSPKKIADLVRFQNVWLDLYRSPPLQKTMQDMVYDYRYSHQSHMINSFKKFSGRTPLEALAYARR